LKANGDVTCSGRTLSVRSVGAPMIVKNGASKKEPRRRRRRATYTRITGVRHLMAAYDLNQDKIYGHVKLKKDRTTFLEFCRYLRTLYPSCFPMADRVWWESAHLVAGGLHPDALFLTWPCRVQRHLTWKWWRAHPEGLLAVCVASRLWEPFGLLHLRPYRVTHHSATNIETKRRIP
jgi:hypothetical protein